MGKRKRTCYLCSLSDDTFRKFPANSRELAQRQWIDRLGLGAQETSEKLSHYRQKIDENVDIRWCSEHFDSPDGLPKDLRPNPPVPTVELRQKLQPQRLQERYRNQADSSTPAASDGEMDMDEGLLETPPRLSPLRPMPPFSPLRLDQLEDDDVYNGSIATLPKRFKTQSSIRTETTIDKGSEYHCSQDIGGEEESEGSESEVQSENGKRRKRDVKYRIVGDEQLRALFRRCQECGAPLDTSEVDIRDEGSACVVTYDCLSLTCGAAVTWESQARTGDGRSTIYEGNQEIAVGAFITGLPLPRLCDFAKLLGIKLSSERSMRRIIRDIACPAIERVYLRWQAHVRSIAKDAAEPGGISVSLDGQYSKPGFNAPHCKVTVLDAKMKLALAACSVNKKEKGIDGVSIRMEAAGAMRAIEELIDDGFEIKTRVSDQNRMVDKRLREDPKTASIEASIDWWHTQKPLKKLWWKAMKTSPILSQLHCSFFNHLYYCHKKYPEKEDRPMALELVRSFLMHIQGKHKWKKGDQFKLVTKCDHEKLKRRKKGDPPRPNLKPTSKEYKMIEEMLYSRNFERAFLASSSLIDTALNECYHSMALMYCPKRFACSAFFYNIKMKLGVLHFNSLILHEMMGLRPEKRAFILPRPGRVALAVKTKREPGEHPWREEARILVESEQVRTDLEEGRLMRRIGMPDDLVFDELWQETQEEEQENDEDEVYDEQEEEEEEYEIEL